MSSKNNRDRDLGKAFAVGKEIQLTHFYSVRVELDCEHFAYGYFTSDGIFCQGVTTYTYDGKTFTASPLSQPPIR